MSLKGQWFKTSRVKPQSLVLPGRLNAKRKRLNKWKNCMLNAEMRSKPSSKILKPSILTKRTTKCKRSQSWFEISNVRRRNCFRQLMLWTKAMTKVILYKIELMQCFQKLLQLSRSIKQRLKHYRQTKLKTLQRWWTNWHNAKTNSRSKRIRMLNQLQI